jgi:hypothetical protein
MDEDFEYVNQYGSLNGLSSYTAHLSLDNLVILRTPPVTDFMLMVNQTVSASYDEY